MEKRPYDAAKDHLPGEFEAELKRRKVLVERGGVMEFRHDRIRAYLAAQSFGRRWRTFFASEKTVVDPNWDAMLEFHLAAEHAPGPAKDLLFLLIAKDRDVAIRVARWGLANRQELFDGWQDELSRDIGKTLINV